MKLVGGDTIEILKGYAYVSNNPKIYKSVLEKFIEVCENEVVIIQDLVKAENYKVALKQLKSYQNMALSIGSKNLPPLVTAAIDTLTRKDFELLPSVLLDLKDQTEKTLGMAQYTIQKL
jgi:mannose/fructose-specific phosphotransferase system component IIA